MQSLGMGLLGCGHFGGALVDVAASVSDVQLTALCDTNFTRRSEAARRLRVQDCTTISSLLASPSVDFVAIASTPWIHASQAMACAEAGKHVFMAEPLAINIEDAEAVVEAFTSRGLRLVVNHPLRLVAAYKLLRVLAQGTALGRLQYFGVENHVRTDVLPPEHWFWDASKSGGFLVEQGGHFFDLANQLIAGQPVSAAGMAHTAADGSPDGALVNVQYDNDVVASFYHLYSTTVQADKTIVRLSFERGSVSVYGWIPQKVEFEGLSADAVARLARGLGGELEKVDAVQPGLDDSAVPKMRITLPSKADVVYRDAVKSQLSGLARCIRDVDCMPTMTPREALDSLRLAIKAQAAVKQGQMVQYADVV